MRRKASFKFGSITQQCYQVSQQVPFFHFALMSAMSFLIVTRWLLQLQASYSDDKLSKGRRVALMHLFIREEIISQGLIAHCFLQLIGQLVGHAHTSKLVTEKEIEITVWFGQGRGLGRVNTCTVSSAQYGQFLFVLYKL